MRALVFARHFGPRIRTRLPRPTVLIGKVDAEEPTRAPAAPSTNTTRRLPIAPPAPHPDRLPNRTPRRAPAPAETPAPVPRSMRRAPVRARTTTKIVRAAPERSLWPARSISPAPHPEAKARRRRSRGGGSVVLRLIAPAATLDRYLGTDEDEVHVSAGRWVHCRMAPEKRLIASAWSGRLWLCAGAPAPHPERTDVTRRWAA